MTTAVEVASSASAATSNDQQGVPSMLEAALYWADHGFLVVPCHEPVFREGKVFCTCQQEGCKHPGKHPRQATLSRVMGKPEEKCGGYHQATRDPEMIKALWNDAPSANIGGAVGAGSGLIAIDIDPRHGGNESFAKMIAEGTGFPETAENASGGGGRHLIYRYPQLDTPLPCKIEDAAYPGVEFLLAPPSGIILPPSVHPSNGIYRRCKVAVGIAECSSSMLQFIEDHLKASRPARPAPAAAQAGTDAFTVTAGATAPREKLDGLLASHETFRQTWNRERSDLGDDLSRHEQSLADLTAESGWTQQEIVNLLIEFRERQGEKPKPISYYDSTLRKARSQGQGAMPRSVAATQAGQLIDVAHAMTKEFFQDVNGIDHAKISLEQGDGRGNIIAADAVVPMASEGVYRDALEWQYRDRHGREPAPGEVAKALRQLRRESLRGGRRQLEPRSAVHEDDIWIDRGDLTWSAIRISPHTVTSITEPPTLWWRPSNVGELPPIPDAARDHDPWRALDYLNLPRQGQQEGDRLLFLVSLILGHVPNSMIAHPMILVTGPEGSAKSSLCDIYKFCVDPPAGRFGEAGRTRLKRGDDLQVVLYNHAVVHLDNVSHVPQMMADDLSTGVTGADVAARKFYTDYDQCTIRYRRQILMTAINHPLRANDLISRTLWFPLPMIEGLDYIEGERMMDRFLSERPLLIGSHLHVLSQALAMSTPRMSFATRFADWCGLGARVTLALGRPVSEFERALERNMITHRFEALEGQFFARAVYELVATEGSWEGTLTELVDAADQVAAKLGHPTDNRDFWPQHPRVAMSFLEQATVTLKQLGVSYRRKKIRGRQLIELERDGSRPEASAPDAGDKPLPVMPIDDGSEDEPDSF